MAVDPVEIPFPDIHPRVGIQGLTIEPGENPVYPAPGRLPDRYAALFFWPRSVGTWFTVQAEAEADAGNTVTRFGGAPADLIEVICRHAAENTRLAQKVATEEWMRENCFLVGTLTGSPVRLKFRVDTNNERFVQFCDGATLEGLQLTIGAVYFDGSVPQPDSQTLRLQLYPATPVQVSRALLAVDLGNTNTTIALLDPFDREGDARRPLSQRIPMLTTRLVPVHGGGRSG